MDKFVIQGVPPFDGEYPIDVSELTMEDLHTIKRIARVRAGELSEAFAAGDTDLMLALAVIAVGRNGRNAPQFEALAWKSPIGGIVFEVGVEEDAAPLAPATEPMQNGSGSTSDDGGDETQEMNLHAIGSPESAAV